MKLHVDLATCVGHGRCYALAPELFDADDEGHAVLLAAEVPRDREVAARSAASNCPEGAIRVAE